MAALQASPDYLEQIADWHRYEPRIAVTADLVTPLPPQVDVALRSAGINSFYSHQAQTINLLRSGHHTVVATGTASGKSLCYLAPIFEAALSGGTALYLAPTRALAADQLRQIRRYEMDGVIADTYDGDTPSHVRTAIRGHANMILTNPDMLHMGILPNHARWVRFLRRLKYVVVDEAHVLRGVFGSHVSLVLRRLRRLSDRYGSQPTFALASATIGNPDEHASTLTGLKVKAVTGDGSPSGQRHFVFWNPPLNADAESRRSSNSESSDLLAALVKAQARSLTFSKSRVAAELVARYTQDKLPKNKAGTVAAYRSGYLASERRRVEDGLQDASLMAVSATNALELGVDIGSLDAVVLNGFPGTVASARQQAGRAGRSGQQSLALIVPHDEPLDQFYAQHPDEFFGRPHEAALTNPSNPHILRPHLGCAAWEHPLTDADAKWFGPTSDGLSSEMLEDGDLRERRDRLWWASMRPPAPDVNIRSGGGRPYRIVEASTGRMIGTSDSARVFQELHPGAIYLHQGETWRVEELQIEDRVALMATTTDREYTQAKVDHDLVVLTQDRTSTIGPAGLHTGLVEVTDRVTAFQRKRLPDGEIIERRDLDLPPQTLVTRAVWYTIPERKLHDALEPLGLDMQLVLSSLHAAEHASIGILPVFAMCDRNDIGGLSTALHPDTAEPTWFIYDGHPMGAGICDHAFDVAAEHLSATRDHVSKCPCAGGCPACVQSPKCGNFNDLLDKAGAVAVLKLLTGNG